MTYNEPLNIPTKLKDVTKISFFLRYFVTKNVTHLIRHKIPGCSIKVFFDMIIYDKFLLINSK